MDENIIKAEYNVTKKEKLLKFYQDNKIIIYSFLFLILIVSASSFLYFDHKENKSNDLANKYIEAKIHIEEGEIGPAKNILKNLIREGDSTYSALSLFLIINENLIKEEKELSNLFDYVLKNHEYDNEIQRLIIFKKILLKSNFYSEQELIEEAKPIINSNSVWKPHILLLLGNYFASKKEFIKAQEFYTQILTISNLNKEIYDEATLQLTSIAND